MNELLPETTRRDIFQTLVTRQDQGVPVEESRTYVADHYHIDIEEVRKIEREGLANQWAPL